MSPIEVTASDAPITVSASGTKVDATVSGGQGPQGPVGPTGPQGPSGASNWSEIVGKPETFPPSAHSHVIADVTDLSDVLGEKVPKAGGAMDENAALTFSTTASNSEVGAWGFGVGLTGETGQYATIEPTVITVASNSGATTLNTNGLTLRNSTQVIVGSFDNSTGGANGIGLICAVGYELNWQGGRLRKVYVGGDGTPQTIHFDSPISLPAAGVTFSDDTTQTTAGATPGDVSAAQSAAEAYAVQRANHTGTQAASTITGLATVATSGAYTDLSGRPTLGTAAAAATTDFAAASHTQEWSTITATPTTISGYGITDAVVSSDSRLTNSRTPTSHKTSHATGGTDALSPSDIGASAVGHTHSASQVTDFSTAASAAAPVQSVNGLTGAVTISTYSLPVATASVLGGVKQGSNVTIGVDGTISVAAPVTTLAYSSITGTPTLAAIATSGSASDLGSGTVPIARIPVGTSSTTVAAGNDSRLSDSRTPTGAAGGDLTGTYPNPQIAAGAIVTADLADGAVTDAKITSGGLSTSSLNWAAIQPWAASTAYAKGDLVSNAGIAYRRSASGVSGSVFNIANWQQITPSEFVGSQITSGTVADARLSANARQAIDNLVHPFLLAGM